MESLSVLKSITLRFLLLLSLVFITLPTMANPPEIEVLFGPKTYHAQRGQPQFQEHNFSTSNPQQSPARIVVKNGRGTFQQMDCSSLPTVFERIRCRVENAVNVVLAALTHVQYAEIEFNGVLVINSNQFTRQVDEMVISAPLLANNRIRVRAKGHVGAFIKVTVDRTAVSNEAPVPNFTFLPGSDTDPLNFSFDATSSTDPDGSITEYQFNFGDGTPAVNGPIVQHKFAANGNYSVTLTVTDDLGSQNSMIQQVTVQDGRPPILTVSQPVNGAIVPDFSVSIVGQSDEPLSGASVNGVDLELSDNRLSFSGTYTADDEGPLDLQIVAIDEAGNVTTVDRAVVIQINHPPVSGFILSTTGGAAPLMVSFDGSSSSDPDNHELTYEWNFGDGSTGTGRTISHQFMQNGTFTITLTVTDSFGLGDESEQTVTAAPVVLPPDPATVAPPISFAGASIPSDSFQFIYSGPNPIQTGVAPNAIESYRAALLRGKVLTRDGQPLSGVEVKVFRQPELGKTLTREDGMFDLAVNGGGAIMLEYSRNGYLSSQRRVEVLWQDMTQVDDIVLVTLDPNVTQISLASPNMQVVQGTQVTDSRGTRQPVLMSPPNNSATMVLQNGSTVPAPENLSIRITEFTVGESGPAAMPASLPPSSAYTYAIDISADEAIAAGAKTVSFTKPLIYYVEDIIGFPPGTYVPAGFYDQQSGQWKAEENGVIFKILSVQDGKAVLTTDDANPITAEQVSAFGFTDEEFANIANRFAVGTKLWRMEVPHFSPWDYNWPYDVPNDAIDPNGGILYAGNSPYLSDPNGPSCKLGSVIEIENQALSEIISVVGTPFDLVYRSDRVLSTPERRSLDIELAGDISQVPSLLSIRLKVSSAGQEYSQSFLNPTSYMRASYHWNGLDAYGRPLFGSRNAKVEFSFRYRAIYVGFSSIINPVLPNLLGPLFGRIEPGTSANRIESNEGWDIDLSKIYNVPLESFDSRIFGIGGWTLSDYHLYSPNNRKVYRGDGAVSTIQETGIVTTVAGGGANLGDGEPATTAALNSPRRVRINSKGEMFIADTLNFRIRKVDKGGVITTVAGGGTQNFSEGMRATDLKGWGAPDNLVFNDVGFAPDGSLYIAFNTMIVRVDENGFLHRFAGQGRQPSQGEDFGDNGPAINALFRHVLDIEFANDGALYVFDISDNRIRKIDTNAIIYTFAGNGLEGDSGDGGPATQARLKTPLSMTISTDGMVYIADGATSRIRRVRPDGIIDTYLNVQSVLSGFQVATRSIVSGVDGSLIFSAMGDFSSMSAVYRIDPDKKLIRVAGANFVGFNGDGLQPTETRFGLIEGMAIHPDGSLLIIDAGNNRIRRIASVLPPFSGNNIRIASPDGSEYYLFSPQGIHLETRDALTNVLKYRFEHNEDNLLIKIHDRVGKITEIVRDADDRPVAIISPYGQYTRFTTNSDKYITSIENPAGEKHEMTYDGDTGLMLSFKDPRQNITSFTYDSRGRLRREDKSNGGFLDLLRTELVPPRRGFEVLQSTAEGRQTRNLVETLSDGQNLMKQSMPDGSTAQYIGKDAKGTRTNSDLSQSKTLYSPDPVFTFQAAYSSSEQVLLPSSLMSVVKRTRAAQFSYVNDLPVIQSRSETTSINNRNFVSTYSGATRTLAAVSPVGRQSSVVLDTLARPVSSQAGGLAPVQLTYDVAGRVDTVTQGARSFSFAYNGQGFLESSTNALNQTTSFEYDAAGRLTEQQLPDARVIAFDYDASGNLESVTPPGRPVHQMYYNVMDLLAEYLPPALGVNRVNTIYGYNQDNQLVSISRPDGQIITLNYHETKGHLSSIIQPLGANSFGYSATTGQLVFMSSYDGVATTMTYDGFLPKNTIWSGAASGSIQRFYNNNLYLSSENINGAIINYGYDNDGLLNQAGSEQLTLNPVSGLLSRVQLGTLIEDYGYNLYGEIISCSSSALSISYVRDSLGRITQKTESVLAGPSVQFDYLYDDAGRLVEVKRDGSVVSSYVYDSNSNRVNSNGVSATYDIQDRLLSHGSLTYTYTDSGELSSKTDSSSGQATSYVFDVFGNLKSVNLPNGNVVSYVVDAQNRRVGKKINGTLVQGFVYRNQLQVAAELDGSGNTAAVFVYGSKTNVPDYMIKGGIDYRIVSDHLGSPRVVVRASDGQVMQQMDYNEFGKVISDTNPGFQPFGFAGGLLDNSTGLVRFGAREYDPEVGRWLQKDPIGFAGGDVNLYGYVLNDPVNFVDPEGLLRSERGGGGGIPGAVHVGRVAPVDPKFLVRIGQGGLQIANRTGHAAAALCLTNPAACISYANSLTAGFMQGYFVPDVKLPFTPMTNWYSPLINFGGKEIGREIRNRCE